MKKFYGVLIGSFLLATIFSVFGQGIAYFLNEHFIPISPVYYLTGLTTMGFLLYLLTAVLIFRSHRKQDSAYKYLEPIGVLLFITAFCASVWSLIVTAMWWG
ncbi:hypothetical protein [Planococcus sp. CAU13]|uniref:hypothetical protein n=1 Tax=Planococcus sp. CAU13 TaxID=1541197 RepID=UPI0005300B06|nr:hypothetical protein [Planococcus sp. CAU13]